MLRAVGSMFTVSFDGAAVSIAPRFHEGRLDIPLAAITDVNLQLPRPLECGTIDFSIPLDASIDGVLVSFFRPQTAEFVALRDTIVAAIEAGVAAEASYAGQAVYTTGPQDDDLAIVEALRATAVVQDQDWVGEHVLLA